MPDEFEQRIERALRDDVADLPMTIVPTMVEDRLDRRVGRGISLSLAGGAIAAALMLVVIASMWLPGRQPSSTSGGSASGQVIPDSSTSPTTVPTVDASPRALTEAEAVEAALDADGRPGMSAANVESGPASQVLPREGFEWADVPSGDTWVWLIVVSDDGPPFGREGSFIVLDYFDGTVYGIQRWIS